MKRLHASNQVLDWRDRLIGFRCCECGGTFPAMWGEVCNGCREKERRHRELMAVLSLGRRPTDEVPT